MTEYEKNITEKIEQLINEGKVNNKCLVKIFELCRDYLNLQTKTTFAKNHNLSYNGVDCRKNLRTTVQKTVYIVDNE